MTGGEHRTANTAGQTVMQHCVFRSVDHIRQLNCSVQTCDCCCWPVEQPASRCLLQKGLLQATHTGLAYDAKRLSQHGCEQYNHHQLSTNLIQQLSLFQGLAVMHCASEMTGLGPVTHSRNGTANDDALLRTPFFYFLNSLA
jgi:hypothetical protein